MIMGFGTVGGRAEGRVALVFISQSTIVVAVVVGQNWENDNGTARPRSLSWRTDRAALNLKQQRGKNLIESLHKKPCARPQSPQCGLVWANDLRSHVKLFFFSPDTRLEQLELCDIHNSRVSPHIFWTAQHFSFLFKLKLIVVVVVVINRTTGERILYHIWPVNQIAALNHLTDWFF